MSEMNNGGTSWGTYESPTVTRESLDSGGNYVGTSWGEQRKRQPQADDDPYRPRPFGTTIIE